MALLSDLRNLYLQSVKTRIIHLADSEKGSYYNMADVSSRSSISISAKLVDQISGDCNQQPISGQTAGDLFEDLTCNFLQNSFSELDHIRPGSWEYSTKQTGIDRFDQYKHLNTLELMAKEDKELAAIIGTDYIIKPDIIIARHPIDDENINHPKVIVDENVAKFSPLRKRNLMTGSILHASISCKWTIRSDRSQNTRTEALNLIRNRKGKLPHIVCVTAEPLPTRIATIALGTGDIDCVYHFALFELENAIAMDDNQDQLDMLHTMTEGRRLRDISDLPLDLAI
jgi:hypothetical protein